MAFSKIETDYYTSRAPLAEIYDSLRTYNQESGLSKCVFRRRCIVRRCDSKKATSDAQVASTGIFLPDAWSCREGSIILNTGKETFEALGLPGTKISARMPGAPEQQRTPTFLRSISLAPVSQLAVINVSLNNTPGANIRSHDFILDSFTRWDQSRERSGEGQWDFTFHVSRPGESTDFLRTFLAHFCVCGNLIWFTDKGTGPLSPSRTQRHEVKPVIQTLQNVCIPTSALTPRPNPRSTSTGRRGRRDLLQGETDADEDDAMQDWNERANSLFEWIGMVNIGAQRHVLLSCFPWGVRSPETTHVALDYKPTIGWTHMWLFIQRQPHVPLATWRIFGGAVS